MAKAKLDGIIEAVRYTPDGRIDLVRAYERRGAVWSDQVLLGRKELDRKLAQGRRYAVGSRKTYLGSVFLTGQPIHRVDDRIVSDGKSGSGDYLEGVPIF